MGVEGRAADARVREDGRRPDLDVRAVPDQHASGIRPADRVGRVERDRICELGQRYPDLLDICCAITGRAPAVGLHVTGNRAGQILIRLAGIPLALQQDDQFFAVLGHLVGTLAEDGIPVIDGVAVRPAEDQLKAFAAAAASSGRVALFHMVGITPEAPTLDAAFQGRAPDRSVEVTLQSLRAARDELTTADGRDLDMVILGSPHFSLAEFRQLAPLVEGRRAHERVAFLITSSRFMREEAERAGVLAPILAFGARITLDTCILASPMLPPEIKTLMTNSAKYAYYAPSLLNTRVTFGSMADCVESAVCGRVTRDDALWR
jgi:predicted aconitase